MATPQKYSNGQTPSEGTARAGGVLSDSILQAAGRSESCEREEESRDA
jgi:hypothetical protein